MTFSRTIFAFFGVPFVSMSLSQSQWIVNVNTVWRTLLGAAFFIIWTIVVVKWGTTTPAAGHTFCAAALLVFFIRHILYRIIEREYLAQAKQLKFAPANDQPGSSKGLDIIKLLPDLNARIIKSTDVDLPYVFELNAGTPESVVHVGTSFTTCAGVTSVTHVPLKQLELERSTLKLLQSLALATTPSAKAPSLPTQPKQSVAESFGPIGSCTMIQQTSGGKTPPVICLYYPVNAEKKWKTAGRAPTLSELHALDSQGNPEWVCIYTTLKLDGRITENGQTLSTASGVINFICFHTLSRLQELDFNLFAFNVDFTTQIRLWHPYTKLKRWPTFEECTWIGSKDEATRKKLLTQTKAGSFCLPAEKLHPLDVGCFELDVNWAQLGTLYALKTVKWQPADDLKGLFVGPSINNGSEARTRQFGFDHMVRVLPDFATVGTACCMSTTQETGPGGSSSLFWKKGGAGGKFLCGGMHHGGVEGMEGFRNRATAPRPLQDLLKKHITGQLIAPPYSKAFTTNFAQMTEDYAKLAALEGCDATPEFLERFTEQNNLMANTFYADEEDEVDAVCGDLNDYKLEVEGSKKHSKMKSSGRAGISQKTWQKAVRTLANKTSGKKSERQLHCVLYNAMRQGIYFFDEAAFDKYIGELDEERILDYIHGDDWVGYNVTYYGEDILGDCVPVPEECLYSTCTCETKTKEQRVVPSLMSISLAVHLHVEDPSYKADYTQPYGCPDYPLDWYAGQDYLYDEDDYNLMVPFVGKSTTFGEDDTVCAVAETPGEMFVEVQKANIAKINELGHQGDVNIVELKTEIARLLKAQAEDTARRLALEAELRNTKFRAQSLAFERLQANTALEERKLDPMTLEQRGASPTEGILPPGYSAEPSTVEGGAGFNGHPLFEQISIKTRQDLGVDATMSRNELIPMATIHEAQAVEKAEAEIEGRPAIPVAASELPRKKSKGQKAKERKQKLKLEAESGAEPPADSTVPTVDPPLAVHVDLSNSPSLAPASESVAPKPPAVPWRTRAARDQRTALRKSALVEPAPDTKAQCYLGNQHFRDAEASMVHYPGERTEEMAQSLSFLSRFPGLKTRMGLSESIAPTPLYSVNPEGEPLQFKAEEPFGPQFSRDFLIPFKNYSERVFKKSGTGYNNGLNAMPPASIASRGRFNAVWSAFMQHAGGWENMTMRMFGLYLDAVIDTVDGHMRESESFQVILGNQLEYTAYQKVADELPDYYSQSNFNAFEACAEAKDLISADALSDETKAVIANDSEWIQNRRKFVLKNRRFGESQEERVTEGAHRFPRPFPDPNGENPSEVSAKFGGSSCTERRLTENGGLAFGTVKYMRNKKQKAWRHAEKCQGWFKKWAKYIWDPVTDRPTGAMAASGSDAVLKSFSTQLEKKLCRIREYSLNGHIETFTDGYVPTLWEENITLKDYLARVHKGVLASKSSAFGQQSGHLTKGEYMEDPNMVVSSIYGIFLTVATHHGVMEMSTPKSLFEAGLIFPEEVFPKDEIHMNKKVDSDTLRCIWNTAVQMEIRTRFFHDRQNKTEITAFGEGLTHSLNFPTFGSASGMGHCDKGGAATRGAMRRLMAFLMFTDFQDGVDNCGVGVDASGWDISVTRTLLMADAWRRADLARQGGAPLGFARGIQNLGLLLSAHVVIIGRTLIEPRWFGLVGSGSPSTTAMNGFCRQYAHSEAFWSKFGRVGLSLCMGDDCHSRDEIPESFRELWQQLGVNIKDSFKTVQHGEEVDFTSHKYNLAADTFYFDNANKLLLRLAYDAENSGGDPPITREQAAGIQFAVRHNVVIAPLVREYVLSVDPEFIVAPEDLCAVDVDLAGYF